MSRKHWLCVVGSLLASAGLVLGQQPTLQFEEASGACARPAACAAEGAGYGSQRIWINAEYLLWSIKGAPQPFPLASVGSVLDNVPGALGQPNTRVLYGGSDNDFGVFSGLRGGGGVWLTPNRELGIEANGFALERRSTAFSVRSDDAGNPLLGRPFFNPLEDAENNFIDSVPNTVAGGITIATALRLWGWETNFVSQWTRQGDSAELIFGYRTLDLRESLRLSDALTPLTADALTFLGAAIDAGSLVSDFDQFSTHNRFHGLQLGGRRYWHWGVVDVGLLGKVGLGWTRQTVAIDGATTLMTPNGTTTTVPGGLLAQTSNIGRYDDDQFTVVPEVNLNVSWQCTPRLRFRVGYSYLYWSSVVRPGAVIDRVVNPRLAPTAQDFAVPAGPPTRPAFAFRHDDFWAHGVDFGVELRY